MRRAFGNEDRRKLIHACLVAIPLICMRLSWPAQLAFVGSLLAVALAVEALRLGTPVFRTLFDCYLGAMVRPNEARSLTGATLALAAALVTLALFPRSAAIGALLVASLADAAATLVGRRWPIVRFGGKSLGGSAALLMVALIVLTLWRPAALSGNLLAAAGATLAEALAGRRGGPGAIDDNVLTPLVTAALLATVY